MVSWLPTLADRVGGPTGLRVSVASQEIVWQEPQALKPYFPITGTDYTEPDTPAKQTYDPRHARAWLSWRIDLPETSARWLRLEIKRTRRNSSISLGEVVVSAVWKGEMQASLKDGGHRIRVASGREIDVRIPQETSLPAQASN